MEKSFEQRVAEAKANVSAISADEANKLKANDPMVLFIDPRDAEDIISTTGSIPDALNVSLSDLNDKPVQELPEDLADHSRTIITACQGGPMGAIAADTLKRRGYTDVRYIDHGTQGWLDAGFTTH